MKDGLYLVLIDIAFAMIMEKHSSSTFHKVLLKQKDYSDNKRKVRSQSKKSNIKI